ncbi:uncharacterized protein BJ212DRAFT_1395437 [Suillus subaureus]|uniref:Uncharacterized protein n=1 Tax=Suillus subaureus TaxID=48587 RepID=A0A9P7DVC8_9AGAM|nr:uncharacterized protein BJ212DRAFT_1395437 [Suillus subaureus]KAG1803986.1 hypothetical protein BJ212DRAFT_1395437 [Suillus subaureus]
MQISDAFHSYPDGTYVGQSPKVFVLYRYQSLVIHQSRCVLAIFIVSTWLPPPTNHSYRNSLLIRLRNGLCRMFANRWLQNSLQDTPPTMWTICIVRLPLFPTLHNLAPCCMRRVSLHELLDLWPLAVSVTHSYIGIFSMGEILIPNEGVLCTNVRQLCAWQCGARTCWALLPILSYPADILCACLPELLVFGLFLQLFVSASNPPENTHS